MFRVSGLRLKRRDGEGDGLHHHPEGQLSWVDEGVQRVWSDTHVWVTPPEFAVWIVGDSLHDSAKWGNGVLHQIQVDPQTSRLLPEHSCVFRVSPKLRGAFLAITEAGLLDRAYADHRHALDTLLSSIEDARIAALRLVLHSSATLTPLTGVLSWRLHDERPLEYWSKFLGLSSGKLTRQFRREMGVPFRTWKAQMRLLRALHSLAEGKPVAEVAREVGYRSVSMFIRSFRRSLDVSPARYFKSAADLSAI